MSNNKIIFNLGEETRPVVETKLANSMFAELYQKTFVEIENYLNSVKNAEDRGNKSNLGQIAANEEVNNIFAFIGERGAGKTSCMLTVANALHLNTKDKEDLLEKLRSNGSADKKLFELIYKTPFNVLDIIDPSFFDNKNNILSLIIAKLFKNFKKKASDTNCKHDEQNRRNLIELFEQVQKNLSVLFSKDDHIQIDSLESLSKLSAAVDLKDDIYKLVDSYLKFVISDKDTSPKLVVMIDDIDLHTQHARDMVELIRKYFIQSNVVILMSVKIDQLNNVLKNHLTVEYKVLLEKDQIKHDLIDQMSERYIGKLIPHGHRFYLPDATVYFNAPLQILKGNKDVESKGAYKNGENIIYPSVRYRVLELIYEKTRFLFYNTKEVTSYIIPTNLRELRQLISMLADMDDYNYMRDVDDTTNDLSEKKRRYNTTLFRNYFLETWCRSNLSSEEQSIIFNLFEIRDAMLINKSCLNALKKLFKDYMFNFLVEKATGKATGKATEKASDEALSDELYVFDLTDKNTLEEYQHILKLDNVDYNISLGDVMALLDYLDLVLFDISSKKLLFAIKFFYSIRLHEYYNEVTESLKYSSREHSFSSNDEEKGFKQSTLSEFNNYEKISGGSFINSDIFTCLTNYRNKKSRSKRFCNITTLNNFISAHITTPNATPINLAELFLLLISRRSDSRDKGITDKTFRKNTVYRLANDNLKGSGQKHSWFDIESFFFNLLDIERCYSRVEKGEDLFTYAVTHKDSLFVKFLCFIENNNLDSLDEFYQPLLDVSDPILLDKVKVMSKYNKLKPDIYSRVAIRNMEVLDDLKNHFVQTRKSADAGIKVHISNFFKELSEYTISTYDGDQITWSFVSLFEKIIKDADEVSIDSFFKEN